ncbi:MAG: hypothetical protein AB7M12_04995 [Hyphomonadaceae bacterium]
MTNLRPNGPTRRSTSSGCDAARAKAEGSWGRRYGTIVLSAMLTLTGTALTWYVNQQADQRASREKAAAEQRAQTAAKEETARTLAQNAVRVYFEHPERFDLNTEEGQFNLRVLAATAPGETTATLLSRVQNRAVGDAVAKAQQASSQVVAAAEPPAATAAPTQATPQIVQKAADDARYAAIQKAPSLVENASKPADFQVFVQYGVGAQGRAQDVQKRIKDLGYGAPGIDQVKVAVGQPEVRYYRPSQEAIAKSLAEEIGAVIGTPLAVKYIGEGRKLPDGMLEVWLPPSNLLQQNILRAPFRTLRDVSSSVRGVGKAVIDSAEVQN